MKNNNSQLAYLIVREYAQIMFRFVRKNVITAQQASEEIGQYMHKMGLPREIVVLTIAVYLALL